VYHLHVRGSLSKNGKLLPMLRHTTSVYFLNSTFTDYRFVQGEKMQYSKAMGIFCCCLFKDVSNSYYTAQCRMIRR
jgi:hypothetical protein